MPEYLEQPDPTDILPREIVFHQDPVALAIALLPWVRDNPRFTFTCLCWVAGLRPPDLAHDHLVDKVRAARRCLGCVPVDGTGRGAKVWYFPDHVELRAGEPARVTRSGFSYNQLEPLPQPFQVEVCRAWLREHARPTREIRRKFSTDSLRRFVTIWTRETGAFTGREQENEFTGDRYVASEVYVTNGAFLQAALDEGYRAVPVPRTGDAWLDLIHRKTGQRWRGRIPGPVRPASPRTASPPRRLSDVVDPIVVRSRLTAFVNRVRLRGPARFKLKEASRAAGIPIGKGTPPKVLTRTLHELGYEARYMMVKGHRSQWWCSSATSASTPTEQRPCVGGPGEGSPRS
jgi:hypothetical protein